MALTKVDYWSLGFLWGSARISGDHLLVQNMDKDLILKMKERTGISNIPFETTTTTGKTSWRMKINLKNEICKIMLSNGYEGRTGNEERSMPSLDHDDEAHFLRGYFSTHYTLDLARNGKREFKRLRFYASEKILNKLNNHLYSQLGTTIKKIGNHSNNEICKILYYQSQKEVPVVMEYLELLEDK